MKALIKKNMKSHKQKNQLTAIIYTLTLGSIIFLLTSANLQIETITSLNTFTGADILIEGAAENVDSTGEGILRASMVDPTLQAYASVIDDFGYLSQPAAKFASVPA